MFSKSLVLDIKDLSLSLSLSFCIYIYIVYIVYNALVGVQIPLGPIPTGSGVPKDVRTELKLSEKLKYTNSCRYEVEMQI